MEHAKTAEEPPHNVIVTSNPPSKPATSGATPPPQGSSSHPPPVLTYPASQPFDNTAAAPPYVQQQQHQFPAPQPQAQPFLPVLPSLPVQRSQSLGSIASTAQQGPYSMGHMQRALPVTEYPSQSSQNPAQLPHPQTVPSRQQPPKPRFHTGPSPAAVAYQLSQQMQQYQGGPPPPPSDTMFYSHTAYQQQQPPVFYDPYNPSYAGFPEQQTGTFGPPYSSPYPPPTYPATSGTLPAQPWYHPPQQLQSAGYYYQSPPGYGQYAPQFQATPGPAYPHVPEQFRRHSVPMRPPVRRPEGGEPPPGVYPSIRNVAGAQAGGSPSASTPTGSSSTTPSVPRGPPRKPKQSGNALWVGNLPPATDIAALKDYFSIDARSEIESVFLISKSNCAFVNYRTEQACDEAMARFHNSKFRGTRLVCRPRPRKGSATALRLGQAATPAGTSGQAGGGEEGVPGSGDDGGGGGGDDDVMDAAVVTEGAPEAGYDSPGEIRSPPSGPASTLPPRTNAKCRYFILKSLTVEDLEMSVKNGVWATQSHNEVVLNQAFETTDNVYLIFSANKSGEYYGYARMTSKIADDPSNTLTWSPNAQSDADTEALPKAIYTAATETAPKGRIIDDSGRGTIFWEALDDDEQDSDVERDRGDAEDTASGKAVSKAWGKPFKVEWISTSRVPFYRTRGLRNILNSGREVKVARDGTELEENAGKRLIQMFQRNPPAASLSPTSSV